VTVVLIMEIDRCSAHEAVADRRDPWEGEVIQQESKLGPQHRRQGRIPAIRLLGGSGRRYAGIGASRGDRQGRHPRRQRQKGDVVKGWSFARSRSGVARRGPYIRFDENAAVILSRDGDPPGHAHPSARSAGELREKRL